MGIRLMQSYGAPLAIWDHTVYMTSDTNERAQPGRYWIYLPRRDGKLS